MRYWKDVRLNYNEILGLILTLVRREKNILRSLFNLGRWRRIGFGVYLENLVCIGFILLVMGNLNEKINIDVKVNIKMSWEGMV